MSHPKNGRDNFLGECIPFGGYRSYFLPSNIISASGSELFLATQTVDQSGFSSEPWVFPVAVWRLLTG